MLKMVSFKKYSIEDFLTNKSFQNFILEKADEKSEFWKHYPDKFPSNTDNFKKAIELSGLLLKAKRQVNDVNKDKEFIKLLDRLENNVSEKKKMNPPNKRLRITWIATAAAIALLLAISFQQFFVGKNVFIPKLKEVVVNEGEKKELQLPDGTKVWVNELTKFSYPEKFKGKMREVCLDGEAFFEVARNEKFPFLIYSGDAVTKVLGTSFNIKSDRKTGIVKVTVNSGMVALYNEDHKADKIIIEKNFSGVYSSTEKRAVLEKNMDLNYSAWKTGILRFENSPLYEVINYLKEFYGKNFELKNISQEDYTITVTFDNLPLNEVLQIIGGTLGLEFITEQDRIIAYPEGVLSK